MAKLDLNKAEDVLATQTKKQGEMLVKMFGEVKKDAEKQIAKLGVTASDRLRERQLQDLVVQLNNGIKEVYQQFDGQLSDSILAVCQGVVDADNDFLDELGIKLQGSFASIPVDVLASIRTGKIYDQKWFLSDALWADVKAKQGDISNILARGLAMNESPLAIARRLEKYVDPLASAASRRIKTDYYQDPNNPRRVFSADYVKNHPEMNWDGWEKKTSSYYFGKVDYNAQRLARTAIAHAYQQSIIQSAKANPMSEGIKWLSALTERTCEICIERDGQVFQPDEIPLDHPNGMCTYEVVLPSMDDIAERLADWVNGAADEGLDNWTDEMFGGKFEVKPAFNDLQNEYLSKYGFSPTNMPKDFSDWSYKLSSTDKSDLFDLLGLHGADHPFQLLNQWYDDNLANVGTRTVFTATTAKTAPSSVLNNAFSQLRKDAAYWFRGAGAKKSADGVLRDKVGDLWQNVKQSWKKAAHRYTEGSGAFNRPLRGFDRGWNLSDFKGIGNVSLDNEGAEKMIGDLTKFIDKSSYDFDIWVQRGVSSSGGLSFLGLDQSAAYYSEEEMRNKILGTFITDPAFFSTGAVRGAGFTGYDFTFNVYCPEGTKMIYAEPFSYYGEGVNGQGGTNRDNGVNWDGVSGQSSFGGEFETILQRGTTFRPIKVERSGSSWYIDLEVVGQM